MIRRTMIIFIALMMGLWPAHAAQDYSRRLDSVLESLMKHLAEKKPEFTHWSIEPIKGSRNVSVNNWESEDHGVRVSIIAYGSEEEAATAMRQSLAIGKKEATLRRRGIFVGHGRDEHRLQEGRPNYLDQWSRKGGAE